MKNERPYSRHYHDLVDDPKFADVYPDDHHYATWSRLLMLADQAWPASAHLPMTARRTSVAKLVEVGLIDLRPNGMFRVHGLDPERRERSGRAKDAAVARWSNAERTADGNAERITNASDGRMPSKDETRKDKQSTADARDPADDYWTLTGKYPSDKLVSWIDDLTGQYGAEAVTKHLALRHGEDASTTTLLGRVRDSLKREARQLDQRERDLERAKVAEQRRVNVPVIRSYHNAGQHQAAPDPRCPLCQEAA